MSGSEKNPANNLAVLAGDFSTYILTKKQNSVNTYLDCLYALNLIWVTDGI